MGFKLMAGAVASCALIGVAVGVGIIYGSLLISIGRNPSQRDELLRYAFIGFSLVEVSGLIGLVISLLLLFGFELIKVYRCVDYRFTFTLSQYPNRCRCRRVYHIVAFLVQNGPPIAIYNLFGIILHDR